MLNGLIKPDQGRIEMRGKVGALIALGAGFNPILTGRENTYVNAAVLGMSKQYVDSKIDEIIDFAEIRNFIDAPVQSYSSGMNVRLGFAIAAVLIEPDILFLDEVLAVGDISFIVKCLNTVRQITNKAAVVFVSHNMQHISRFCTRIMVMNHGIVMQDSTNLAEGIDQYYALINHNKLNSGTGGAEILSVELRVNNQSMEDIEPTIPHGAVLSYRMKLRIGGSRANVNIFFNLIDAAMDIVTTMPLHNSEGALNNFASGTMEIEMEMGVVELASGKYSFIIGVVDATTGEILSRVQGVTPFRVISNKVYGGKLVKYVVPRKIEVLAQS
ncbi:MAG: Wzt carbohydrate-binding domain-containing protein [Sedimentisphaerales bacterium]